MVWNVLLDSFLSVNSEPTMPHKIKDMSWKSSNDAELCVTVSACRS